jgi:beta-mannosidase
VRITWDLSGTWQLTGWRQYDWERAVSFGTDVSPDVRPVAATVPGSVRRALIGAGVVPDPFHARSSRESEWIEHRHWTFTRDIPGEAVRELERRPGARIVLRAEVLDYAGSVLVDDRFAGSFKGSIVPVEIDLTDSVRAGASTLTIAFTEVPDGLAQIGRTSQMRAWKARFGYGWDWTPRVVQTGIGGPITLEVRDGTPLTDVVVTTGYDHRATSGAVTVRAGVTPSTSLRVSVTGPGVETSTTVTGPGPHDMPVGRVEPWLLQRAGDQSFYDVTVTVDEPDGESLTRRVGFRSVRWEAAAGAPDDAEPWTCVVNGSRTFLTGVNWVPIRPDYVDVTEQDYRIRLEAFHDMGVRLLRVWGGAALESETFYDLCDELGLLVWQELPMSSSGLDNTPPRDDQFAAEVAEIAASYVHRRAHHPSLIMWDTGNELTDEADRVLDVVPLSAGHPAAAAAARTFGELDPGRRFVVTSPSGPSIWGLPENVGKGLHHDVHGPWAPEQFAETAEQWRDYWESDDALMRSEVGVCGASPMDLLTEFGLADEAVTGADKGDLEELWAHSSGWWLQHLQQWDGHGTLADWVDWSQRRQAEYLAVAAELTVKRFPAVGGFIVWLGHDTFPCALSLSLLDFHGRPKPVAAALGEVFRAAP